MPGHDKDKVGRRRSSGRRKSSAQRKHQERAKKAMQLFKSGKYKSLKLAWAHV